VNASSPPRVAIIPARWGSARFPGKPLALVAGKPLVLHVLDRVRESGAFDVVRVATDDDRIESAVRDAGGEVRRTRADHPTGSSRVAEAAAELPDEALVVNVQGDEPVVPPALLRALVARLAADPTIDIVTAAHPATDAAGFASPHVVKVVVDAAGRALYFSRAGIPAGRGATPRYLRHVGLYGFRRAALARFVALPAGELESTEGLEQLRALEHGMRIDVVVTAHVSHGVDTPADLKAVAKLLGAP
jgi:3-deoxy-manno-octulosonate cytidylyltransferase (CMP-KDO synthetase)